MMNTQLFALFAFGLVITGIVYLGILRAREYEGGTDKSGSHQVL